MIWSWTAEATTKPMRYLTVAEYAADRPKLRIAEPGRHATDVAQLALLVGKTDQQGTEERARAFWFGPAADECGMNHRNSKFKMQNSNDS